jgi:hypothetical protein
MKAHFLSDVSDTPPSPPKNPAYGYPTNGDRSKGIKPTAIGAWWYNMINLEFENVIIDAGLEPDINNVHQLADIFADFRTRASNAEQYKADAEAAAKKAEEYASGVVTETAEKIKEISAAGDAQVSRINESEADIEKSINDALASMQTNLSAMIQQIDDEGSSQSVYVKQEAQDLLDQITNYRDQAQNAANNAYNDALKMIDDSRVKTSEQSLSDTQKAQARTNINAVSESELKAALEELIIEYGGTIPSD